MRQPKTITVRALKSALKNKEFILHYQPKTSMVTGKTYGAEALLRWQQPDGTLVPPFEFIPLAEKSEFIQEITHFVFSKLIEDMTLINAVNDDLVISFNASGKDFHDSKFTNIVLYALKNRFIDAKNLEIEVTETVLMDEEHAKVTLAALANKGVSIAMDDFGEGHSGLATLSKWPFTTLKIDKGLIDDIATSGKNHAIIQASIRMAHQLNIDVVAEGIEDEETYQILQSYGCKAGQGFWICKPLPLEKFIKYLKTYKQLPAKPVGLLYMAQLDHLQWRKAVIDSALFLREIKGERTLDDLRNRPELDHTQCKLGKWYYGQGRFFKEHSIYKGMEAPHRELHTIGEKLLRRSMKHCHWDEFTELTHALSKKSMEVLESLQSMENYLSVHHSLEPSEPSHPDFG